MRGGGIGSGLRDITGHEVRKGDRGAKDALTEEVIVGGGGA